MSPVKDFQSIWEKDAARARAGRSTPITEKQRELQEKKFELGILREFEEPKDAVSAEALEYWGDPVWEAAELAKIQEEIDGLQARATEQQEHYQRLAAEAEETAGIKKEQAEERITAAKDAAKERLEAALEPPRASTQPPLPQEPPLPGKPPDPPLGGGSRLGGGYGSTQPVRPGIDNTPIGGEGEAAGTARVPPAKTTNVPKK